MAGGNREHVIVSIRNSESLITIKQGSPVFLDPTLGDGLSVKSAESFDLNKSGLFFGVALNDTPPGLNGDSIVFGFFQKARIMTQSRAASTDSWPGYDAANIGDVLNAVTIANAQALTPDGSPNLGDYIMLMESYSSAASSASDSSDSDLFKLKNLNVFLRAL